MQAFDNCSSLISITVKPEVPPTGNLAMFSETNNAPIFVPTGSVEAYKSARYWNEYADRIQAIPSAPVPEAVDLGLPSGLKWASFNLGATKPEEYGDYYAWGETEPYYEPGYAQSNSPIWKEGKEAGYDWPSYKWCMGRIDTVTKYCKNYEYGYNHFEDGKTILDPEDDAALMNLGGSWRMPTDVEWAELRGKCTWEWTSVNAINGRKVTGPNGNSIFLPAAGHRDIMSLSEVGSDGHYWSSSLHHRYSNYAWFIDFWSGDVISNYSYRFDGLSVRPVTE